MHPEDLKMMWVCQQCGDVFIFHSDTEMHAKMTGHKKVVKMTDVRYVLS